MKRTMNRAGVIGLGDMGSGLAKNLIQNGFQTTGHDLSERRMRDFTAMGGAAALNAGEVGANADAVYVMVMNGAQAKSVILGEDGLRARMAPGGAIILSATIIPQEAREIGAALEGSGLHFIDSPVSGGYPGAQNGALTMMAAAPARTLDEFHPFMAAVSKSIHHVGERPGDGQTVKACLQSIMGSVFASVFEAAALAAKAGISGEAFYNVLSSSSAGCVIANTAMENIIDRKFEGTGSHIATMHKDLTISLDLARELGAPLFTASTAMQLFQAGKTKHPEGDNWVVTRILEDILGVELHR